MRLRLLVPHHPRYWSGAVLGQVEQRQHFHPREWSEPHAVPIEKEDQVLVFAEDHQRDGGGHGDLLLRPEGQEHHRNVEVWDSSAAGRFVGSPRPSAAALKIEIHETQARLILIAILPQKKEMF